MDSGTAEGEEVAESMEDPLLYGWVDEAQEVRRAKYYRQAIWLPVLAPVVAAILILAEEHLALSVRAPRLEALVDPITIFGLIGGIGLPGYLIFVAIAWRHVRRADARALRRLMWIAPTLLATAYGILGLLLANPSRGWSTSLRIGGIYGAAGLLVGYGYVLMIEMPLVIGRGIRCMTRRAAPCETERRPGR